MRCRATTTRGVRCKNAAQIESRFCNVHNVVEGKSKVQARDVFPIRSPAIAETKTTQSQTKSTTGKNTKTPRGDCFSEVARAMNKAAHDNETEEGHGPWDEEAGVLSQTIYSTSYYVGYGVAFPTLLIFGMLPATNSLGRGLRDGAVSAQDTARRMRRE